ncbi:hypothetical protein [Anaerocolumna sp. MB42-C2]|uniref:hypothetical protein n=1 Tax=Anaerocolumna sp. MB42-C2 TaxID=3070997 RepID=UPI0027E16C39|nr:hypothetical protein [Anaerocolumna sp. MB42-C2]WMJ86451.1 hypothetical protein RBU59_20785 [Anaerocolumna sp. MB42-C2]
MKDLENLRYDANFQVQISKGLFWVPVCTLGNSRYTNEEVLGWVKYSPDEKKRLGLNLYESIQLLYMSDFRYEDDYKLILFEDKKWEFHKSAQEAIKDNYGNCAAICAWIQYMCEDAYVQSGFLHYIREDGCGHVVNYFYLDSAYYIVDVTAMVRTKSIEVCVENGEKSELRKIKGEFPICLMSEDLQFYYNYHTKLERLRGHIVRHFLINGYDYIPPISVTKNDQGITINTAYHAIELDENSVIKHTEVNVSDIYQYSPYDYSQIKEEKNNETGN